MVTLLTPLLLGLALAGEARVSFVTATGANSGHDSVQVIAGDDTVRDRLTSGQASVRAAPGTGTARVSAVRPLTAGVRTALAFDQSGSFKAHWRASFDLAATFADALPPSGHETEVVTFGVKLDVHGEASNTSSLASTLATARAAGAVQGHTRLRSFIRDVITRVDKAKPVSSGALRQVIVFTDAGEESDAYNVDDVVAHARSLGVAVHIVAFVTGGKGVASRLDAVERIAERTGGRFIQVGSDDTTTAMQQLARIGDNTFWVDLTFCDVPTDRGERFNDTIAIEVWGPNARLAATDPASFRQHAAGGATAPCTTPTPAATPTPAGVADTTPTDASAGWPWWWWIPLLALLLLSLGLFAVTRRRGQPEPAAPAPRQPPPQPPAVVPTAARAAPADDKVSDRGKSTPFAPVTGSWDDPLERLPSVTLVLLDGPDGVPSEVRIHKRTFTIGARGDRDLRIDAPQVSSEHASIKVFPNGNVFVRDHGSTNGSFVNGSQLEKDRKVKLSHGDRVAFSRKVVFRVNRPGAGDAAPAPRKSEPSGPPPPRPPAPPKERTRTIISPIKPPSDGES